MSHLGIPCQNPPQTGLVGHLQPTYPAVFMSALMWPLRIDPWDPTPGNGSDIPTEPGSPSHRPLESAEPAIRENPGTEAGVSRNGAVARDSGVRKMRKLPLVPIVEVDCDHVVVRVVTDHLDGNLVAFIRRHHD